jgi:beta-lactamase superfamily II metal-dependent hydrolase
MQTEFQVLKAEHGDSMLIKTHTLNGKRFVILIDGGTSKTYTGVLKNQLRLLEAIDLMVLTHIDADHIKGLIKFIESDLFDEIEIKRYWFNSMNIPFLLKGDKISYGQAVTLEKVLIGKNEIEGKWNEIIVAGMKINLAEGIVAEIISPTTEILKLLYKKWPKLSNEYYMQPEDIPIAATFASQMDKGSLSELAQIPFNPDKTITNDIFNSSSLAFVLRTPDMNLLLLGDARPEVYIEGLKAHGYDINNKLKVDYVKISHHGSMNNTSLELANIVDCENYIISTNGGLPGHRLPDRETIARIIYNTERVSSRFINKRTIYFNYPLEDIEVKSGKFIDKEDMANGNWQITDNTNSFN